VGEIDFRRNVYQFGSMILAAGGFLLATFLILDAFGVVGNHTVLIHPWLSVLYLISIGLGPLLALILAGLLVYLSLTDTYPGSRLRAGFAITVGILLVLGMAAVNLRHSILVKATSRAPEDHFPLLSVILVIGIGLTFLLSRKKKVRWSGAAFLAVAPLLIVLTFWLGLRFDPHAITEARAIEIGQAIERYHQDTGRYPAELGQLQPDYLSRLLGPLTGRGQIWCYQSGPDYYRLGYVLFERYHQYADDTPFWEPYYEIKVPAFAGQPPAGPWACDIELEWMKHGSGFVNINIWVGRISQGEQEG
jgi:hypothetical protein